MAQKIEVRLIDDIDGGEAVETVQFALDGVSYELDLSKENVELFRAEMSSWASAGRKTSRTAGTPGSKKRSSGGTSTRRDPEQTKAIKEWAAANGFEVPDRGRMKQEVLDAYEAAHKPAKAAEKPAEEKKPEKAEKKTDQPSK